MATPVSIFLLDEEIPALEEPTAVSFWRLTTGPVETASLFRLKSEIERYIETKLTHTLKYNVTKYNPVSSTFTLRYRISLETTSHTFTLRYRDYVDVPIGVKSFSLQYGLELIKSVDNVFSLPYSFSYAQDSSYPFNIRYELGRLADDKKYPFSIKYTLVKYTLKNNIFIIPYVIREDYTVIDGTFNNDNFDITFDLDSISRTSYLLVDNGSRFNKYYSQITNRDDTNLQIQTGTSTSITIKNIEKFSPLNLSFYDNNSKELEFICPTFVHPDYSLPLIKQGTNFIRVFLEKNIVCCFEKTPVINSNICEIPVENLVLETVNKNIRIYNVFNIGFNLELDVPMATITFLGADACGQTNYNLNYHIPDGTTSFILAATLDNPATDLIVINVKCDEISGDFGVFAWDIGESGIKEDATGCNSQIPSSGSTLHISFDNIVTGTAAIGSPNALTITKD